MAMEEFPIFSGKSRCLCRRYGYTHFSSKGDPSGSPIQIKSDWRCELNTFPFLILRTSYIQKYDPTIDEGQF